MEMCMMRYLLQVESRVMESEACEAVKRLGEESERSWFCLFGWF